MNEERRERMAQQLIDSEHFYRRGEKALAFRTVLLVVAELIGVVYRLSNKEES